MKSVQLVMICVEAWGYNITYCTLASCARFYSIHLFALSKSMCKFYTARVEATTKQRIEKKPHKAN